MALPIPGYLKAANLQDGSLRYEWDDWRTLPALKTPDENLVARLKGVSQRGVLAYACGAAEWLVYRFAKLCDDPAPWNYLEAAWAMMVDAHYVAYGGSTGWQVYAYKGWDGPVRRPIRNSLNYLEIAFQQLASEYHADPATFAAMISALAGYVMTGPAPYDQWCEQVLSRLEALYPRDPKDPLGDVVPRQAVDPDYDFSIEQTEALVRQFLASLDRQSNIFLSSPEGMLEHFDGEEDFQGTPYVFDMQADRDNRRREGQSRVER